MQRDSTVQSEFERSKVTKTKTNVKSGASIPTDPC